MLNHHTPAIREACPVDWRAIRALLLDAGLPVDDLGPDRLDAFLVAENNDAMIGLIGLDVFGTIGLLRSLVVEPEVRGDGLGSKLVDALEATASAAGLHQLWLLTIDAEGFFQRHAFEVVDRAVAPEAIRRSAEFTRLCPGTAFVMRKTLIAADGGA